MEDLGLLITLTRRHVWNAATRKLEASGYSMLWWAILGYLIKEGASTQRDMAVAVGQHPAGVSRLVDEMEARSLLRRGRDELDRRRARVEPTPTGRAMFEAAHPLVKGALKESLRALSPAEQRQLSRLLRKLISVDPEACIERVADRVLETKREATSKRAAPPKRAALSKGAASSKRAASAKPAAPIKRASSAKPARAAAR